ncbi:Pentatricopeptide repeat-containing protein, chloroplastic [Symbiodinium microadriaticum]|uniref:Pentatricopeptide repeat-containing protein, chloroplastic n=1 Tax=Symbiodinium microadriaticum TaxID=2951 RepID=A0A1Q9D6Z4_SYMMI|nr:Pentatricopeptide repeat-containing protein, chloroplastic [Symbiodinium microadriaticum]
MKAGKPETDVYLRPTELGKSQAGDESEVTTASDQVCENDVTIQPGPAPLQDGVRQALVGTLTSLQPVRADLVRGTPAYVPLQRGGRILRGFGVEDKDRLHSFSFPTEKIAQFWSHSWHGATLSKVLMLLVLTNGIPSICMGTLGGTLVVLLWWTVGPLQDPVDPLELMLCTTLFSVFCCGVTFFFWRPRHTVFLDQICIHQADVARKTAGLISMAAILKTCDSIVVCWDSSYMQRAWCVFEMAAFIKAHGGDAKLLIRPSFQGPCSVACHAGVASVLMVNLATFYFANTLDISTNSLLRLGLILLAITSFMFAAVTSFRRYYLSVQEMQLQLRNFAIEDTLTHCCTQDHKDASGNPIPICDEQIIIDCIVSWFGSTDAFNQRVRERMEVALVPQLGHFSFSYSWMVACSIPVLWAYMPKVFYAAFTGDWTFAADQVFFIVAWWLGAFPILNMCVLSLSNVLRRKCSRCVSFFVNLLASGVVLPVYIGIEIWIGFLSSMFSFPASQVQASEATHTAAVTACERGGEWQQVWLLPGAVVSAAARAEHWEAAILLFEEGLASALQLNLISYTAAIGACEKGKHWELALAYLASLQDATLEANEISYNAAISACEKGEQWQQALALFAEARVATVRKDVITFNATLSACEKCGQWQPALVLLQEVEQARLERGTIAFNAALSACGRGEAWGHAVALLAELQASQVPASEVTYNAAITACERGREWQQALAAFAALRVEAPPSDSLQANRCSYNFKLCGRSRKALQPTSISYSAAISACEVSGRAGKNHPPPSPSSSCSSSIIIITTTTTTSSIITITIILTIVVITFISVTATTIAIITVIITIIMTTIILIIILILILLIIIIIIIIFSISLSLSISISISICSSKAGKEWAWALVLLHEFQIAGVELTLRPFRAALSKRYRSDRQQLFLFDSETPGRDKQPSAYAVDAFMTCDDLVRSDAVLVRGLASAGMLCSSESPFGTQAALDLAQNAFQDEALAKQVGAMELVQDWAAQQDELASQGKAQGERSEWNDWNIDSLEKGKQWTQALELLCHLDKLQLTGNVITYNAAISACGKCGRWRVALSLLEELRSSGLEATEVTYGAVVSACEKGGQWERALLLLQDLEEGHCRGSAITYNAAISACDRCGHWEHAEAAAEPAQEKPAAASADDKPAGAFHVHDNGGRPFKVEVQWPGPTAEVQVFKSLQYDGDVLPSYEDRACVSFSAERVLVGRCPKHGAIFDGNSVLLHVGGLKYVFIGVVVFAFTAKSRITAYVSRVGNNDVPYPWAIDEQGWRYLMIESVVLSSKLFESDDDPYDLYYDRGLITAQTHTVPPQEPKMQFQGIEEFWIGENQRGLRYQTRPEVDFECRAGQGEFFVVKGDPAAKIKLSKDDYVKLMHDFADEMGFEPLSVETLLERHI